MSSVSPYDANGPSFRLLSLLSRFAPIAAKFGSAGEFRPTECLSMLPRGVFGPEIYRCGGMNRTLAVLASVASVGQGHRGVRIPCVCDATTKCQTPVRAWGTFGTPMGAGASQGKLISSYMYQGGCVAAERYMYDSNAGKVKSSCRHLQPQRTPWGACPVGYPLSSNSRVGN